MCKVSYISTIAHNDMKNHIVTRKVEVRLVSDSSERRSEGYRLMRSWQNRIWRMANDTVNVLYMNDNTLEAAALRNNEFHDRLMDAKKRTHTSTNKSDRAQAIRDKNAVLKEAEDKFKLFQGDGLTPQNMCYRILRELNDDIPSSIRSSLNDQIKKNFSKDREEVLRGERSIRTYKNGMPVPFQSKSLLKLKKNNSDEFSFSLFPGELKDCHFVVHLGRDRSDNASVLKGLISGEYKLCDSSFTFDGTKLFFLLVISTPKKEAKLDPEKTIGVDLGVHCMLYYSDPKGKIKGMIGGDGALQMDRRRLVAQRKSLQQRLAHARGGRGRKHKLAPLDRLGKKEKNFASTFNHTYAKQLIDVCLRHEFGLIIMEDLKGLNSKIDNVMLRHWSYFDLQTKIEQKASKYDIVVKKANPAFTSQTCSSCGYCDKENRKNRDTFSCRNKECVTFGKNRHADLNACINLANGMGLNEKVKEEEVILS